jgi:hypothetical protein
MAEQGQAFSVISSTTSLIFVATGLTSGTTYEFKIEAKNEYGYSEYSETMSLLAAATPEVPISVTTEMAGNQVKVAWQLPSDNGSPITEYKLFIKEIGSNSYTYRS